MSSIVKAIDRTYKWIEEHNGDKTYWAIDLHGTVLKPDYRQKGIATEFYPYAKETLQLLTKLESEILILFSSTAHMKLYEYEAFFGKQDIEFFYWNQNPEVDAKPESYADFQEKFYFNVMLEDKAGFEPETDWKEIYDYLKRRYQE